MEVRKPSTGARVFYYALIAFYIAIMVLFLIDMIW